MDLMMIQQAIAEGYNAGAVNAYVTMSEFAQWAMILGLLLMNRRLEATCKKL